MLARLLVPKDFGIINIALVFTQLAYVVFDLGLNSALIQKKQIDESHYRTAFTFYNIIALIFMIVFFIFAPYISRFFEHSGVVKVIRWLLPVILFHALSAIPLAILMRGLN